MELVGLGYVEWVPGVFRGITLVNGHPGTKGSEELQVKIASHATICHMGSVLTEYVGVNLGQEIDICRVDRWAVTSW